MSARRAEKRQHRRHALACPVAVLNEGGDVVARGKTLNISDGGALFAVPVAGVPAVPQAVRLDISVPRSTPNTYMLEPVSAPARVLRHEALVDPRLAGLAVRFESPLDLALEV